MPEEEKKSFITELQKDLKSQCSVKPSDRFYNNSDGKGPRNVGVANERAKDRERDI
jgi:hypothetical protein